MGVAPGHQSCRYNLFSISCQKKKKTAKSLQQSIEILAARMFAQWGLGLGGITVTNVQCLRKIINSINGFWPKGSVSGSGRGSGVLANKFWIISNRVPTNAPLSDRWRRAAVS